MKKYFFTFIKKFSGIISIFLFIWSTAYSQTTQELYQQAVSEAEANGEVMTCSEREILDEDQLGKLSCTGCPERSQGYGTNCWDPNSTGAITGTNFDDNCIIDPLPSPACGLYKVPLNITIFEDPTWTGDNYLNGTGFQSLADTDVLAKLAEVNQFYSKANIEFVICDGIKRVDNIDLYDFYDDDPDPTIGGNDGMDDLTQTASYDLPNSINLYFVGGLDGDHDCCGSVGFAPYPCSRDYSIMRYGAAVGGTTLAHELGHYFGLFHTHAANLGGNNTNQPSDMVNNCDCLTTGDGICDTWPSPRMTFDCDPTSAVDYCFINGDCTFDEAGFMNYANNNGLPINSLSIDPETGTALVPNCLSTVLVDNVMGYFAPSSCRIAFSPCQYKKINDVLLNCRDYLCCRDVDNEFANGLDDTNITICPGDPPPTFNTTSNCYSWHDDVGDGSNLLASNTNSFTPTIGTGMGELDNMTPGTYTWYLGDANEFNNHCRTEITVTVAADPGDGTETGGDDMVEVCGNNMIALETDATSFAEDCLIGWWITESNPASAGITNDASLTTAIGNATIGGPISNTVNHIIQATSGTPITETTIPFDCDNLNNNLTYYATPMIAKSIADIPSSSCIENSTGNSTTVGGDPGQVSTNPAGFIDCAPSEFTGCPTFSIDITVSGYTGAANDLRLNIRNGGCALPSFINQAVAGNGTYTFTEANFIGCFDPNVTGLCILIYESGGTGALNATLSFDLNIMYPGLTGTPFPGVDSYNNCLFGDPVQIICNCPSCPTVTPKDGNMGACTVGSLITNWKAIVEATDGTGATNVSPDGTIYEDIIYSATPPATIATTNPPATEPSYVWDEIAAGGPCDNLDQTVYAYVRCDLNDDGFASPPGADDTYTLAGTYILTLYPPAQAPTITKDDNVCNYSITFICTGDAEGATNVNGSTEASGYAGNTAEPVEVTTTNGCTQTFMVNKPACTNCPTVTPINDSQMVCAEVSAATVTTWKTSLGADFSDPSNLNGPTVGLLYSSVPITDASFPQAETNGTYDGDNCANETEVFYAYYECDTDNNGTADEYIDAGSLNITIFPNPQQPTIVANDDVCTYSIMFACAGDTEGATTSVDGSTEAVGYTGNTMEPVEVVTSNGCTQTFMVDKPNCSSFAFNTYDPCVCNNDQTANGAGDGTFFETVVVTGEAGVNLCAGPNSSGILSVVDNMDITATMPAFTENPAGTYTLNFHHLDAVGYTLELYDCTNNVAINAADLSGANVTMVSNNCYYPIIQFAPTTSLCASDPAINLAATLTNDMPDGATSFNGTFTYAGTGGVTGTQFDPSVGSGNYTVTATYTPMNAVGTNTDADDTVCTTSVEVMITVSSPDATFDCPTTPVPRCEGSVALNPTIAGGTWSGDAAPFVTNDELDPSDMNAGTYTLIYSITDANNCTDSVECTLEITYNCAADGGRFDEED